MKTKIQTSIIFTERFILMIARIVIVFIAFFFFLTKRKIKIGKKKNRRYLFLLVPPLEFCFFCSCTVSAAISLTSQISLRGVRLIWAVANFQTLRN